MSKVTLDTSQLVEIESLKAQLSEMTDRWVKKVMNEQELMAEVVKYRKMVQLLK